MLSLLFIYFFYFLFFFNFYDSHREREREAETQAEGEADSMHWEPDVGLDPRSPGLRPGPKTGAKPLRHPGIPHASFFFKLWFNESPYRLRIRIFSDQVLISV